jgi:AraC-like DNA-binding protein
MQCVSRLLVTTRLASLGEFRCPPGDERWGAENSIGREHHLVFPRRAVRIAHAGAGPVVADPNVVVIYPPDGLYRRALIDPAGDHCVFVTVADELALEQGLNAGFARARSDVYASVNLLAAHAAREAVDALLAEEILVGAVAGAVVRAAPITETLSGRNAVEDARAVLAARHAERLSLSDVAAIVGLSPFHLARQFRKLTGTTMHRYRDEVRLRVALPLLAGHHDDLARLALDLGYSSHSHFATSFRRAFGAPPSALGGRRADLRDKVAAVTGATRHV